MKKRAPRPTSLEVEGNKGGSYVRIAETGKEGICYLEVGETCVRTIQEEVPVAWLAAVLTKAHDDGFQNVLRAYGWSDAFIQEVR